AAPSDPAFSLLLSLPRELRDRIYTFALVSPYPFWWPAPSAPKHGVALGLLTVSRQVHEEAAPLLYSLNKFLFTHPSDCNIFRVISSPFSENITSVYLRIREKDVKLWATYLGSKTQERSMKADLPKLKSLWIFLRCGTMGTPNMIGQLGHNIPGLAAQVHAINAIGGQMHVLQQQIQQQIQALQQQVSLAMGQTAGQPTPHQIIAPPHFPGAPNSTGNGNNGLPPGGPMPFVQFAQNAWQHNHHPAPPTPHPHGLQNNPPPNPSPLAQHMALHTPTPPPPVPQHQHPLPHVHHPPHPHQHTFYASFLRLEREMGLENLCLSLQETRPADADVKIVCILKLPKAEVQRLLSLYPDELQADRNGDARTRFRRLHGVDVSLEVSGY
ncbi:hypothetical protein BU26DRAFT_390679, partial [Trematosphaeria pertusa]